jgi:arylsulfatase A
MNYPQPFWTAARCNRKTSGAFGFLAGLWHPLEPRCSTEARRLTKCQTGSAEFHSAVSPSSTRLGMTTEGMDGASGKTGRMPVLRWPRWASLLALLVGGLDLHAADATPPPKPNFILILADDLGYGDIGPFGSKANRTPNLDRMAREGMRLTSFYACPVCTPSRAQFMTGCYAKRVSLPDVIFPACPIGLDTNELTLPRLLQQQGYATMAIGKWHLGDQREFLPTRHGFDHYFGLPYSNDMGGGEDRPPPPGPKRAARLAALATNQLGLVQGRRPPLPLVRDEEVIETVSPAQQARLEERYTAEAVRFIRQQRDKPFFLYLAHTAVHVPLHPGAAFQGRSANGTYGDWVEELDWSVGQVFDVLRDLRLETNTFVIFTSDNGPWLTQRTNGGVPGPLRGGKGSTWEGGVREPTVAWWPGRIAAGSACDAVAANLDLLPTLVKLAGGSVPAARPIDGADIWPLLSGASTQSPREAQYYFAGNRLEAVRAGSWKLALGPQPERKAGGVTAPEEKEPGLRLYRLDTDIGERTNVLAQNPKVVQRLLGLVAKMQADLGTNKLGPGVRSPGRVAQPVPLLRPGTVFIPDPVADGVNPMPLDGMKIGDALARNEAPQVGGQPFCLSCEVEAQVRDGVVVAQGGARYGYALHFQGGKLLFTVRTGGLPVPIEAKETPPGRLKVEARLARDGAMTLAINGRTAASGKADVLIPVQPQEDFCLGHDNGMAVGNYDGKTLFKGLIEKLNVVVLRQ